MSSTSSSRDRKMAVIFRPAISGIIPPLKKRSSRSRRPNFRIRSTTSRRRCRKPRVRPCGPAGSLRGCHFPAVSLVGRFRGSSPAVSVSRRGTGGSHVVGALHDFNVRVDAVGTAINPAIALCRVAPRRNIHVSGVHKLRSSVTLDLSTSNVHVVTPVPNGKAVNVRMPGGGPGVISKRDIVKDGGFRRSGFSLPVILKGAVAGRIFVFSLYGVPRMLITNTANRNGSINLGTVVASLLCGGRPTRLGFILISPGGMRFDVCSIVRGRFLTGLPSNNRPVVASIAGMIRALGSIYIRVSAHCSLLGVTRMHGIGRCGRGFVGHHLGPRGKRGFVPCVIIIVSRFNSLVVATNGRIRLPVTHVTRLTHTINVRVVVTARHPAAGVVANAVGTGFPTHVTFHMSTVVSSQAVLSHPNTGHLVNGKSVLFLRKTSPIHIRYTFVSAPRMRRVAGFVTHRRKCPAPFFLPRCIDRSDNDRMKSVSVKHLSPLFRSTTQLIIVRRRNSASLVRHGFTVNCGHTNHVVSRLRGTKVINPARKDGTHSMLYVSSGSLRVHLGGLRWSVICWSGRRVRF